MIKVEEDLRTAIDWQSSQVPILPERQAPKVFYTGAKCNHQTIALLKKEQKEQIKYSRQLKSKERLFEISKPIALNKLLSIVEPGNYYRWHITPVDSKKIAIRISSSCRWNICMYAGKDTNRGYIPFFDYAGDEYSEIFQMSGLHEPSPPPLIPKNIVEICHKIKSFRTWRDWSSTECRPFILYKPDTYQIAKIDPAIVAKVCDEWRIFAIWGDIVEQAEIISFQIVK